MSNQEAEIQEEKSKPQEEEEEAAAAEEKPQDPKGRDIPDDLTLDILSRLPASSILRFRRACNLWRSSTREPQFISLHLRRALATSRPPTILLFASNNGHFRASITLLDRSFAPTLCLSKPYPTNNTGLIGCNTCNGVVCVYTSSTGAIELLNPTTGDSLSIPKRAEGLSEYYHLAYHGATHEYKLVCFYPQRNSHSAGCAAYTVGGTGSWRPVGVAEHLPAGHGTTIGGIVYWITHPVKKIVSFDVGDEKLGLISPPTSEMLTEGETYHFLLEVEGSICLALCPQEPLVPSNMDIWMLNGHERCKWIRKYSIIMPWESGHIPRPIYIHGDRILVMTSHGLGYHNLKNQSERFEEVYFDRSHHFTAHVHVESLVAL